MKLDKLFIIYFKRPSCQDYLSKNTNFTRLFYMLHNECQVLSSLLTKMTLGSCYITFLSILFNPCLFCDSIINTTYHSYASSFPLLIVYSFFWLPDRSSLTSQSKFAQVRLRPGWVPGIVLYISHWGFWGSSLSTLRFVIFMVLVLAVRGVPQNSGPRVIACLACPVAMPLFTAM